jgi:hypothetical protein
MKIKEKENFKVFLPGLMLRCMQQGTDMLHVFPEPELVIFSSGSGKLFNFGSPALDSGSVTLSLTFPPLPPFLPLLTLSAI